jgi:hypothetical protein
MLLWQALFPFPQHIYEKREGSGAGSGSAPLTNEFGSGSGRPKKHADPADPDPQHWLLDICSKISLCRFGLGIGQILGRIQRTGL